MFERTQKVFSKPGRAVESKNDAFGKALKKLKSLKDPYMNVDD